MILSSKASIEYGETTFNFPSSNDFSMGSIYELGSVGYNIEAMNRQVTAVPESCNPDHAGINDTFPCKLYLMLCDTEEQGFANIVAWQPHGRWNRKAFVKHIMPTYFRMTKFESFQRQLNLYGFNRITTGRDKGGYYHESFLRGRGDLCCEIQRHKVKGTRVRKPVALETQPNFYAVVTDKDNMLAAKNMDRRNSCSSSTNNNMLFYAGGGGVSATTTPVPLGNRYSNYPITVSSTSSYNNHYNPTPNMASSTATATSGTGALSPQQQPLFDHSLVSMSKSATPEAFARMLQNAARMDLSTCPSIGSFSREPTVQEQQHQQQQHGLQLQQQLQPQPSHYSDLFNEKMSKRRSMFWDHHHPSSVIDPLVATSSSSNCGNSNHKNAEAPEPILLRFIQQPQQQPPLTDELDRSFDALLSVLSHMDPTNNDSL